jgi:hypothetical protein
MTPKQFLKSAGVGIAVAAIVLVIGVAGEVAWLGLGLPGVHRTTVTPTNDAATTSDIGSTIISESYADISTVPTIIASGVGLVGGFWWRSRRISR